MTASSAHTVALRSDGYAVAFGYNLRGECNVPVLPNGVFYVSVDADYLTTILLRSDGNIVVIGDATSGQNSVPGLPPGLRFVEAVTGRNHCAARRCDGVVVQWGHPMHPSNDLPVLPWGVHFVQLDGWLEGTLLRRSDGLCEMTSISSSPPYRAPALPAGSSYVDIAANDYQTAARVGPTSTYISYGHGCAGSQQAARLVPMDTPRIDKVLEVNVFDLPHDVAFMLFGWNRTQPLSLASYGMPGCDAHVTPDGAYVLLGQHGWATYRLPIPNLPGLVGLRFHNQAVVLDQNAGNALGAVMSDAAEGVVGHW